MKEKELANIIIEIREQMLKEYDLKNLVHLNSGKCEEFAKRVRLKADTDEVEIMDVNSFWKPRESGRIVIDPKNKYKNIGKWDLKALKKINKSKLYPQIFDEMLAVPFHVWISFKGKFYDAECENGVSNLFDLEYFKFFTEKEGEERQKVINGMIQEQIQMLSK